MTIETEREDDGRFIAEIPDLPGVMAYGMPKTEAGKRRSCWHCASPPIGAATANRRLAFPCNETTDRVAAISLRKR